jgi:hypothetical protein
MWFLNKIREQVCIPHSFKAISTIYGRHRYSQPVWQSDMAVQYCSHFKALNHASKLFTCIQCSVINFLMMTLLLLFAYWFIFIHGYNFKIIHWFTNAITSCHAAFLNWRYCRPDYELHYFFQQQMHMYSQLVNKKWRSKMGIYYMTQFLIRRCVCFKISVFPWSFFYNCTKLNTHFTG